MAYTIPIFKDGNRNNVTNYRPISFVFAKVFESLINEKILDRISHSFSCNQHAYLVGRSAVSNLLFFVDHLTSALDFGHQLDTIYLDFTEAFDKVDHSILRSKLVMYGFRGNLLKLLSMYLTGRNQIANIKGDKTKAVDISSGVPQGSIPGPILFAIFINDIFLVVRFCKILGFADDTKLFHTIFCIEDAMDTCQ